MGGRSIGEPRAPHRPSTGESGDRDVCEAAANDGEASSSLTELNRLGEEPSMAGSEWLVGACGACGRSEQGADKVDARAKVATGG